MSHFQEAAPYPTRQGEGDHAVVIFPSSFAQQRLWFLDRLMGASSIYNISWAIRLHGKLDVMALQQSLNAIVARHETLRTGFAEQDGGLVQVIRTSLPFEFTRMTIAPLGQENDSQAIQDLLNKEGNKPFDLKKPPLLRALLLTLSEQAAILLVTIHHSVTDGWSTAVLKRELACFYAAFCQGKTVALPELPIQYADYAMWQREWLQGEVLKKQLDYWKTQLANLTVLELPTDHPHPKQPSHRGAQQTLHLPSDLLRSLKQLGQQHGVTLFMTLLAAFQVLLHRYSGQDDIAVGTAVAGRNRPKTANLIGFFVNTLVLRTDLSGEPGFLEVLGRVRKVCLEAYAHQDMPFEKLVAELQPSRDRGRNPLFQVMLVLEPAVGPDMPLAGLETRPLTVATDTAKFDLTLALTEQPDELIGVFEYRTDLFDAATIGRMTGHFQTLLEAIASQPDTRIAELPLLTAAERHQLLNVWNATQADYPKGQCVHQLFEAQAARTPDAVALVFENQPLRYRELNAKANQLAHYLASLHNGPETLVGICLERSPAMLVALLATLKSGGVYLPLDPTYPKARLAFLLADTQTAILITHTGQMENLPPTDAKIIYIDQLDDVSNEVNTHNPVTATHPENLAYVIYTSGSTGLPKGVAMPHRALVNLLHWQTDGFRQTSDRRILQFTSLNFDVSFQEIFTALTTGGCLVLISEKTRRDPHLLLAALVTHQITDLFLPFIALKQLAIAYVNAKGQLTPPLRFIITAGEQLHAVSAIQQFVGGMDGCRLVNHYGPTECHVVTAFNLPDNINAWNEYPPIGYPIDNTQIYLLDSKQRPVPVGIPGELHIGGDCLARGYLNRPDLTAEKFIPHPFSADTHARLYKTGDLARYLPDGAIDFLGRVDRQVKLRGFRIEPGEIESVLTHYPDIDGALVLVREDQPDDRRLVAYLTHPENKQPEISKLRSFLKEQLPDYMVPSAFVLLASFPLTPNGKVDRQALPAPNQMPVGAARTYAPPRTAIEEDLVAIWQTLLNVGRIGIYDNFLELGGDSILAMKLVMCVEERFQTEFPLSLLFEEPTIAVLSEQLAAILSQGHASQSTPIPVLPRIPYKT